jgi:ABC-type uncharacterized transport system fused permease/ATPase subunit
MCAHAPLRPLRSFVLIFVRIAISTARQNLGRATVSSIYMRNWRQFWANLIRDALLGFASNSQLSASMWCRRRVGFMWRKRMTEQVHEKYFAAQCYYRQHDLPSVIPDVRRYRPIATAIVPQPG